MLSMPQRAAVSSTPTPFGASAHKLAGSAYIWSRSLQQALNCKAGLCAPMVRLPRWMSSRPAGRLLEPNGTLAFEDAVEEYARIVRASEAGRGRPDLFETFTDLYELKGRAAGRPGKLQPIPGQHEF